MLRIAFTFMLISTLSFLCTGFICINMAQLKCQSYLKDSSVSQDETAFKKSIFIFGLGYVGSHFARLCLEEGWKVSGTSTNYLKIQAFRAEGIDAFLFDESGPMIEIDASKALNEATYVLSTIPPVVEPNPLDPVLVYHQSNLRLATLSGALKWIGYLSSTGVYGDCKGAWVSESTPTRPDNAKTKARAVVEQSWINLQTRIGLPIHVFRLAGIYGPGRSALESIRNARGDLDKCGGRDDSTFISRIHVSDICNVLRASMDTSTSSSVINVADNSPATRYEVLSYGCKLLDYPVMAPESNEVSSTWASRGGSKRVDNSRMTEVLRKAGKELLYPDYRSGLSSLLHGETETLPSTRSRPGDSTAEDKAIGSVLSRIAVLESELAELKALVYRIRQSAS